MDKNYINDSEYNKTLIFAFFLGGFGVHRFIHGKIITGVLMALTFGGFGIWTLVDIILIVSGNFKNKDSNIIRASTFFSNPVNIVVFSMYAFYIFFSFIIIISITLTQSGEITKSYDTLHAENSYTVPATKTIPAKKAVFSDAKSITLSPGNYVVGEDIPAGTYDIELASGSLCVLWVDSLFSSDLVMNHSTLLGDSCSTKNEKLKDGNTLRVEQDSLLFIGEPQILSEAVPEKVGKEAYDVMESIEYNPYNETCYIESSKSECEKLKTYDDLLKLEPEITKTTSEKLKIYNEVETCYIDDIETNCSELKTYEEMKKEIIIK